jgi:dienelactone hydrolase
MTHPQPQGFLAVPPTGQGPGVLVLHAWWGLNDTMKAICTRLAESGFVAFAPDFYHGKVVDTIAEAETLGKALDANHLQANDEFEPQSNVDELEASLQRAGRPVTFYRYAGTGHWFFEPDRSEAYNQAAASLAWDRTLAFLKRSSSL